MPIGMDFAFFGSSLVSAYWNGAATYYRGIIRALSTMGHRVTFFEPDAFARQNHRDLADPNWARVVVYEPTDAGVRWALEQASQMDLIVKCSGVGVYDQFLEHAVPSLRRHGNLTVFWDVDAPATLERIEADPLDAFRADIPRYDLILTYGGGDRVVNAYKALGARKCVPIYNALDSSTHFFAHKDPAFAGDLGFLGNRLPDRESRVDEFFLRVARKLPNRTFVLGGEGWGDKSMPSNVKYLGHVYTYQHNRFNSSVDAVLNINRASMARYGFSPPTRIFEAAGAGACIITDAWDGIEMFLAPGQEVLVAHDGDEVAEHLESVAPERRRQIGVNGQNRVLAQHTYTHRAVQLESLLGIGRERTKSDLQALGR